MAVRVIVPYEYLRPLVNQAAQRHNRMSMIDKLWQREFKEQHGYKIHTKYFEAMNAWVYYIWCGNDAEAIAFKLRHL